MATLPLVVRHGEPTGAAQVDIGQLCASTRLKSSLTTHDCFMSPFHPSNDLQQLMKHAEPCMIGGRGRVSQATAYETPAEKRASNGRPGATHAPKPGPAQPRTTASIPTSRSDLTSRAFNGDRLEPFSGGQH